MAPVADRDLKSDFYVGLAFGVSQFITFILNAALFLIAGEVLKSGTDMSTQDVFTAIFALLFAG